MVLIALSYQNFILLISSPIILAIPYFFLLFNVFKLLYYNHYVVLPEIIFSSPFSVPVTPMMFFLPQSFD